MENLPIPSSGKPNVKLLIWAVLNILLGLVLCILYEHLLAFAAFVCGVIALGVTLSARNAALDDEEQSKLRLGVAYNIAADISALLMLIF